MMTPDYASPEQVRGLPITTATDVYSLGAVLYELLTGERPHRLKNYLHSEIERAICQTETEKPSVVVSRTTTAPAKQRKQRGKQLSGDLDNVVLMAMRKEPDRRYSSVDQFADDIRRYLEGRPVIARQDTITYRASKFIRRHTLGLAATTLVILSLVGGIVVARYQAQRAERRFQQVRKLANTFLFDFYDKIAGLQGSTEAREAVAKTGLEYLESLAQEAKGDPELQIELAEGYSRLARVQGGIRVSGLEQLETAMASSRKALALSQELVAREPQNTRALTLMIGCYIQLADFQRLRGDMASAPATMGEALRLVERLEAQPNLTQDELVTVINLFKFNGDLELEVGNTQAALQSYRRSLRFDELMSAQFPGDRSQHSMSLALAYVGDGLAAQGDVNGAMDEYQKALDIRLENVQQNPNNATYRRELAVLYAWMGNYSGGPSNLNLGDRERAEQYYRQSLAIEEELAADDQKNAQAQLDLSFGNEHLADALLPKDAAKAAEHYRQALAVLRPLLEKSPDELRYLRRQAAEQRQLAAAWQKLGDRLHALSQMREALELARALSAKYPATQSLKANLFLTLMASAGLLLETGARQEASKQLQEALTIAEEMAKARPGDLEWQWRLADAYSGLGQYHGSVGSDHRQAVAQRLADWREARVWRQKALALWDAFSQHAVTSAFNTTRRDQAAYDLRQCDAALTKLNATAER